MMDQRFKKHLDNCKLTPKGYYKVIMRINKILETNPTNDQLLIGFANQCYRRESDRKLAKLQAKLFLEAVYGSIDDLLVEGPHSAAYLMVFGSNIDLNNWQDKFEHYLVGYELGKGATSEVKIALNLQSDKMVALKIMEPKRRNIKHAANEISILNKLRHKNIVKVYDSYENVRFDDGMKTVIAIEYMHYGVLIDYLIYTSKFEDELARWFFSSLVEGVEYCHSQNIIHRDLKLDNCLLSMNFVLKISDFGFATYYYRDMMKTPIGTAQYAAPEILEGKKYKGSVDIFSLGVMLFIAIAGTMPWRLALHTKDRWYKWVHMGKWEDFFQYHERSHMFTEDQKNILKGILEPDPEKRWTTTDIRRCRWYLGKKNAPSEVAHIMRRRKREMDRKNYRKMQTKPRKEYRAVDIFNPDDIFTQKLPNIYFQPIPPLSFITDKKAGWALEDISTAITELKGTIDKEDKLNYKLTFWFKKKVFTSRYKNKETKEKLYDKVRVHGSVQMWKLPGQQKALDDIAKANGAVSETQNQDAAVPEIVNQKVTIIKSVAVFRCEGSSEEMYIFPKIFSDILEELPADIISKDVLYDDDEKEAKYNIN